MGSLKENLKTHTIELSDKIGVRNHVCYDELNRAADYIVAEFEKYGYKPELQKYRAKGKLFKNIIALKKGGKRSKELIVVGAHYDSAAGSPGANDNASGVSALLELSRTLQELDTDRSVKFIAFANEEPPFFFSKGMGSRVYVDDAKKNSKDIRAMVCLETIGYYSKERKSQRYPLHYGLFYPDIADFIGAVGNFKSRLLIKIFEKAFKRNSDFNLKTAVVPKFAWGANFSDHDSFWRRGYRACMVTDTAFYRYPHYHTREDTYEKLDYGRLSLVVEGLHHVLLKLTKTRLI